jgi:hypothetical protein
MNSCVRACVHAGPRRNDGSAFRSLNTGYRDEAKVIRPGIQQQ